MIDRKPAKEGGGKNRRLWWGRPADGGRSFDQWGRRAETAIDHVGQRASSVKACFGFGGRFGHRTTPASLLIGGVLGAILAPTSSEGPAFEAFPVRK